MVGTRVRSLEDFKRMFGPGVEVERVTEQVGHTGPVSSAAWWRRRVLHRYAAGIAAALVAGGARPWGADSELAVSLDGASVVALIDAAGEIWWGAGVLDPATGRAVAIEFTPGLTFAYDVRSRMAQRLRRGGALLDERGLPILA